MNKYRKNDYVKLIDTSNSDLKAGHYYVVKDVKEDYLLLDRHEKRGTVHYTQVEYMPLTYSDLADYSLSEDWEENPILIYDPETKKYRQVIYREMPTRCLELIYD